MLKVIVNTKNPAFWIILHIILGVLCTLVKEFFVIWFFLTALSSLNMIATGTRTAKLVNLLYLVSYFASFELMSRMTKAYQYKLPWEFGKYVVFFGALYAIVAMQARKGTKGFLLFILLLPAMFFGGNRDIVWHDIVYNLLGPMSIAFGIVAYTQVSVTKQQFRQILKLLLYPAISVLAYVYIKTPEFKNLEFELGANFDTTGGFGSNQVSTILGMGLFLCFIFWVNRWQLTGNRTGDMALMLAFAFQGLLSFSRGGMLGGLLGILILIFFISKAGSRQKELYKLPKIGKYVLPGLIGLVVIFQVADGVTGGLLSLRYQGETNATLRGTAEVDLNSLTTGRFEIFEQDVAIWQDHFVMGAGAGVSQIIRGDADGFYAASHVELSRLLAEHGLFGLLYFGILLFIGAKLLVFKSNPKYQGVLVALFAIAVYTTFHAATRTYISPLLIGLSLITITDIKEPDAETA